MFVIVFGSTNMDSSVINSWIFYPTSNGFLVFTLINNYTLYFWHLEIWQHWCFPQFYHSRIEVLQNCSAIFVYQFLLWEMIWRKVITREQDQTVNRKSVNYMISYTFGQGRNKLRNRIDECDVIRFVSMTSLGSRAAPDCRTGQSRGRYCARAASILPPEPTHQTATWTLIKQRGGGRDQVLSRPQLMTSFMNGT